MTIILIVAVLIAWAVTVLAVRSAISWKGKARAAEWRADAVQAEIDRMEAAAKRIEAIREKQQANRDRVNTGDPGADFAGSVDVLSNLSASGNRRRVSRQAAAGGGVADVSGPEGNSPPVK